MAQPYSKMSAVLISETLKTLLMTSLPNNLIFTVCTGRCGQHSLGEYLSKYTKDTLCEVEPPNLFYPDTFLFGNQLRNLQRKWLVTNEMLGRGKAIEWFRTENIAKLRELSSARLARIRRLCKRHRCENYFEVSKFFVRTYFDATFDINPNIGVLLLRRDPLSNAKSFLNRGKNFALDNQLPHENNVILKMRTEKLSKFQLYLWQWCEVELRYRKFIREKKIYRHYEISNVDLDKPEKLCEMLDYFSIPHVGHENIISQKPINTNVQNGFNPTKLTHRDYVEFENFLEMMPPNYLEELTCLIEWRLKYQATGL